MMFLSHSVIRHTLRILLNEKITGLIPLKPKHHRDLISKIVVSHKLLYFAPLIIFMDGLYLNNNFRMLFLSLYCFRCCCCWLLYFIILLFSFFIIPGLMLCSFVKYYFLGLLSIPIIYLRTV